MIVRPGLPVLFLAMAFALSPSSGAQGEDAEPRADDGAETVPAGEPTPTDAVETLGDPLPSGDHAPGETEPGAADDAPGTDAEPTEAEPTGAPAAEVFVPTEEISEDFAVPFPVDI